MPRKVESQPDKEGVAAVIERVLATTGIEKLVGRYFATPDPELKSSRNFAGYRFDSLAENPRDRIVASDLVAVSLLDVSFRPEAVDALLSNGPINKLLEKLPEGVDLWNARESVDDLLEIFWVLDDLHDVGPTKASKLLARKRPRLAPITDRHVAKVFSCKGWEFLIPLADCLAECSDLVTKLKGLKPEPTEVVVEPSVLRLLDVAIWMTQSDATSAKDAREVALGQREPVDVRAT